VRFQSCFGGLQAGVPYAQLALACGYYDQAHFNREFRHYAGMSPSQWKRSGAPLNRWFLDPSSRAWLCGAGAPA
jgi:AraC-like DNA-binding protein